MTLIPMTPLLLTNSTTTTSYPRALHRPTMGLILLLLMVMMMPSPLRFRTILLLPHTLFSSTNGHLFRLPSSTLFWRRRRGRHKTQLYSDQHHQRGFNLHSLVNAAPPPQGPRTYPLIQWPIKGNEPGRNIVRLALLNLDVAS